MHDIDLSYDTILTLELLLPYEPQSPRTTLTTAPSTDLTIPTQSARLEGFDDHDIRTTSPGCGVTSKPLHGPSIQVPYPRSTPLSATSWHLFVLGTTTSSTFACFAHDDTNAADHEELPPKLNKLRDLDGPSPHLLSAICENSSPVTENPLSYSTCPEPPLRCVGLSVVRKPRVQRRCSYVPYVVHNFAVSYVYGHVTVYSTC